LSCLATSGHWTAPLACLSTLGGVTLSSFTLLRRRVIRVSSSPWNDVSLWCLFWRVQLHRLFRQQDVDGVLDRLFLRARGRPSWSGKIVAFAAAWVASLMLAVDVLVVALLVLVEARLWEVTTGFVSGWESGRVLTSSPSLAVIAGPSGARCPFLVIRMEGSASRKSFLVDAIELDICFAKLDVQMKDHPFCGAWARYALIKTPQGTTKKGERDEPRRHRSTPCTRGTGDTAMKTGPPASRDATTYLPLLASPRLEPRAPRLSKLQPKEGSFELGERSRPMIVFRSGRRPAMGKGGKLTLGEEPRTETFRSPRSMPVQGSASTK